MPKTLIMEQVEQAYITLRNLDWLQETGLAREPKMTDKARLDHTIVMDVGPIPSKESVPASLTGALAGKSVGRSPRNSELERSGSLGPRREV